MSLQTAKWLVEVWHSETTGRINKKSQFESEEVFIKSAEKNGDFWPLRPNIKSNACMVELLGRCEEFQFYTSSKTFTK